MDSSRLMVFFTFAALLMSAGCTPQVDEGERRAVVAADAGGRCARYEALATLLGRENALFLGEMHGQVQTTELMDCLIRDTVSAGEPVVISLEMSERADFRLRALPKSAGGATTVANPELVCELTAWADHPLVRFHFHSPATGRISENGAFDQTYDEQGRARRIREILSPSHRTLVLGGWRHARNTFSTRESGEIDGYAGYYLRDAPISRVRLVASEGGVMRNCVLAGGCGLHEGTPMAVPEFGVPLTPSPEPAFNYYFDVGRFAPSSEASALARCPEYVAWLGAD